MKIAFTGNPEPILARLESGLLDDPASFDLKREAEVLAAGQAFERLAALEGGGICLFPHQERAVWRVLRELRGRAILADEVGLGKTIEAGVILQEYRLRGLVSRALVLVPPALITNWQAELKRLGVDAKPEPPPAGGEEAGVWLVSLAWARGPEQRERLSAVPWDMVIVDEAHRLRRTGTQSWKLVNSLRSRYLLLLTATPVQNDLRELYNLVTLLKPGQLRTYAAFRRQFMIDRHSARNVEGLQKLLRQVMVRTTRRETLLFFPRRIPILRRVIPSAQEREAYEACLDLAREAYARLRRDEVHLLPYVQLLRQVTSHPASALMTVRAMKERTSGSWPGRRRLEAVEDVLAGVQDGTAKLAALLEWLRTGIEGERVVVFTEFRGTQRRIVQWLDSHGIACSVFHGGMSAAEREDAVRRFAARCPVMVCTDAGSEGHNWQFARTVINFDLPWNPMRVEQRIGRVYRLGQKEDVRIGNLMLAGTVEEYVVDLLHRKLGMFEQVIGDLDDVLGDDGRVLRRRLTGIILGTGSPEEEKEARDRLAADVAAWKAAQDVAVARNREWSQVEVAG